MVILVLLKSRYEGKADYLEKALRLWRTSNKLLIYMFFISYVFAPLSEIGFIVVSLHPGHVPAFIGAFPTFVRAFLAVVIFKHAAFISASITDCGANPAKLLSEVTITRHIFGGKGANIRAIL